MQKKDNSHVVFRKAKRLYIRPISKEDLPQITVWINDPDINQFLKVDRPMSVTDEENWFTHLGENKGKDVVFAIVLVGSNELIGLMGLHKIDHKHQRASTGSFIGRKDLWNKGYGTEAKMLVLEYAFNTLNLRKVHSIVYDFNPRSKACLEKCGYTEEGCLKEHSYRNGRWCDEFQMAVFRDKFLPLWEKYRKEKLGQKK
jgi:RimJ/RimL family protein N-acetyltransferase